MIQFKCGHCKRTLMEFELLGRLKVGIKCSRCDRYNKRTIIIGFSRG